MKITENSSQEQELAISFKSLALDIFKHLSLTIEDRGIDGLIYLNKIYNKYTSLIENSQILNIINKNDKLLSIKHQFINLNDVESQEDKSLSSMNSNPISTVFD
jgi:hypothetical protein